MRIGYQVDIEAPADLVWPFIDEAERWPLWMRDLHAITYPDGLDRANPVGARIRQLVRRRSGVLVREGKIIAYEPRRRFAISVADKGMVLDIDIQLGEMGTGTFLAYESVATASSAPARLLQIMLRPVEQLQVSRAMARLKQLSEDSVCLPSEQGPP